MSNIKTRVTKLEQRQPLSTGEWARIIVRVGETKQEACDRWRTVNLDRPLPDNIVYRIIVEPNR